MSSYYIYNILSDKPHNTHYLDRYYKFICSIIGKDRRQSDNFEKHHICPKAADLFPEYKDLKKFYWNKILLTHREHFIAHWMLMKVYGRSQTKAFFFMCVNNGKRINSKSFALTKTNNKTIRKLEKKQAYVNDAGDSIWATKEDQRVISGDYRHFMLGRKMRKETNEKRTTTLKNTLSTKDDTYWKKRGENISNSKKGILLTEEHKQALSLAQTGLKRSPEHIENIRLSVTGLKRSDDFKQKCKERASGIITVMDYLGVCQRIDRSDDRIKSGELIGNRSKRIRYKDSNENIYFEFRNHPMVLNGELTKV